MADNFDAASTTFLWSTSFPPSETMAHLLLDTHLVLWWLSGDPRLSISVISLLQDAGQEVFVSQALLWGMAIKTSLGRLSADLVQVAQGRQGRCEPMLLLSADRQLEACGTTVRLV
jgi:hypothetical protein